MEYGPIMPLDQNPHLTVTRFGCVSLSMYACGFSVTQMYIDAKIKMSFIWKDDFFLTKSPLSASRSQAVFYSFVQEYTQPYSFGGRKKQIICQIRHELSVTIHEISSSWKKKTLGGCPYINAVLCLKLKMMDNGFLIYATDRGKIYICFFYSSREHRAGPHRG